jgi:hypothetical protein
MTVTSSLREAARPDTEELSADERASIDLAVAQWLRSTGATSRARERLRWFGVSEREIEARRRCTSADRRLQRMLRLAVTAVIARGHLEPRDVAVLGCDDGGRLARAIVAAASRASADVVVARRAGCEVAQPPIAMDVGDY